MVEIGTMRVKSGLAEMLKGGVIMDVTTAEQARIAEDAGACAVMALERVPADIRAEGGVARMADPDKIVEIQEAVTIPVMAKARIGHFVEAQILEALEVDYIDESEVLTPADMKHHVDKWSFTVPFVCGCTNLGEALRRISEGAAMIRTKGEAGTGDVVNAVTHMRAVFGHIRKLQTLREDELYTEAKELQAPYELVKWVAEQGRLPVVTFTAGGIATPADAALCMQLGADGVFVGALEDWFGWLSHDSPLHGFHWGLLLLEVLTVAAALWALRVFRHPLLVAAAAGAGWYFVADLLSSGGNWSAWVSLLYGLCLLPVAAAVGRVYGFWLHVVSGLTIGGALIWFWHTSDWDFVLIGLVGLAYVFFGGAIRRSSWTVLGAVGLLLTTVHFIDKWFGSVNPLDFIFGFGGRPKHDWARPLGFVALGFVYVALGIILRLREPASSAQEAPP